MYMEWINVTDRLPTDMESVMVTVKYNSGAKCVYAEGRYNENMNRWEWLAEPCFDTWNKFIGTVTHWMAYPAPAED